ncbi:MAG: 50S ribosomal protein L29 [Candidatus Aenigmarchaeota archaeon]|nr:50S ribosomal protein L29 [Candidatus Aenigmarchaeota archaeon]
MAIVRAKDARKMTDDEKEKKLRELTLELAKEKSNVAIGGAVKNPGRLREMRRTIARLKTTMAK